MIRFQCQRTNVLVVCLVLAIAALSISSAGCKSKKSKSTYGPGGEWVGDLRDRIQKDIDDPEKVTALLAVVDKIEIVLFDLDGEVKAYYAALTALDKDYTSTREQFQAEIDQFNTMREEQFDKLLSYMFEMKQIAGKEDWAKVSDIEKTLYESWESK
jgi:hypothetical protein